MSFEANEGQTDSHVQFLSHGHGYTVYLTGEGATLSFENASPMRRKAKSSPASGRVSADVIRMQVVGARSNAVAEGRDELPGKSNYFVGNDPRKWRSGVANYAKVQYRGIYPGIDLVYYGSQSQLEYDFVVAPGATPGAISLEVSDDSPET